MTVQGVFFKECEHSRVNVVVEKRGPHHAKKVCADCGKFIAWMPSPETLAQRVKNTEILTALAKIELPEWERNFVRDLAKTRNISPKQQSMLWRLETIYLKGNVAP